MITVFLADDHALVREGIRRIIDAEQDLKVIGEAAGGLEVADDVARTRPDVLVLDLGLPGLSGLEVIRLVN